jgi:hypothetical protein
MGKTSSESIDQKTGRCRTCREPIYQGALRCNACESRQGWTRVFDHFHIGGTTLALITALISVLTVSLPTLIDTLRPDASKINCAFVRSGLDYPSEFTFDVQLFVSNSGKKTGSLGKVWLRSATSPTDQWNEMDIPKHYFASGNIETIAPGDSKFLYYSRKGQQGDLPPNGILRIEVIDFNGDKTTRETEFKR